ncbi:hypothetical protein WJX82_006871 [Trebouxia sp. C0006]
MPVNDLMYDVKLEYNMEGTVPLSQLLYQMQLTEFAQPAADCIPRVHDIAHDDTRTAHNAFVSKPTAVRSYGLSNPRHLRDLMEVLARYYLHRNLMNGFSNCEVKWYGYA